MPSENDSTSGWSCVRLCHDRLAAGAEPGEVLAMLSEMLDQFRPDPTVPEVDRTIRRATAYIGHARKLLAEATKEAEHLTGILKPAANDMDSAPSGRLILWLPLVRSWQFGCWDEKAEKWRIEDHLDELPSAWLPIPPQPSPAVHRSRSQAARGSRREG